MNVENGSSTDNLVTILYFSSSGNTDYIAKLIAEGIKSEGFSIQLISLDRLEKPILQSLREISEQSVAIGVGAPIYALNLSPNILKIIRLFPKSQKKTPFFLFDTKSAVS
jgi:flavodoxin